MIIGISRLLFYPFIAALVHLTPELPRALRSCELTVIPLPGAHRKTLSLLGSDPAAGLEALIALARNPFQRWAAQHALSGYIHTLPSPFHFLYALLDDPQLDAYVFAPVAKKDWQLVPSLRKLLLGELAGHWVDCNDLWGKPVWRLTRLWRDRRESSLTRFAGLLYELLDEEAVQAEEFNLTGHAAAYERLDEFHHGAELTATFTLMAHYLAYQELVELSQAPALARYSAPVRPPVLAALRRLAHVGAEVAAYRDATSRVTQLSALARAIDELEDLEEYVTVQVAPPERYLLQRIIRRWRRLVSEAGGRAGRAVEINAPVTNPYVAGNPVTGALFVGRQDILRRLEELWAGPGQKSSVVLYGHRRMGKSSILLNLGERFGPETALVDFNMQRVGQVAHTGELLYNLALALYDAQTGTDWEEPTRAPFLEQNPYTAFNRFLFRLDKVRGNTRFIITVDEFELLEKYISKETLEEELLGYWRSLIQTHPWFILAFAGLHTLEEMQRDYWHPFFSGVTAIHVGFLSAGATRRLLTQPTLEFPLDYDADALDHILALTNGQPYLVQLLGHGLVTRFNRQTFEEGAERERRFSLADVRAVSGAPEFFQAGNAYFTGLWQQAQHSAPPEQLTILRALAPEQRGLTFQQLAERTELAPEPLAAALATLQRHDVVREETERWRFTVELMRRWVEQEIP